MSDRFLRSKAKRLLLYKASGGRCAICGLPISFEEMWADHIVPYAMSGRTNIHEMQSTCRICNSKKGDGFMDLSNARPGQLGAHDLIISRLRDGVPKTALVMACGYGKSDLIRMSAFSAWDMGLAACTLALSPNEYLREQLVNGQKFAEWVRRYSPRPRMRKKLTYSAIRSPGVDYNSNGEFLLSSTIQLVVRNLDNFRDWIDAVAAKTSLPVVLVADETHRNSSNNEWGQALQDLHGAGAYLVAMTGTPMREDGDFPYGFTVEEVNREEISIFKTKPGSKPETIRVQLWEGDKVHYNLVPDFNVPFRQGWDEGVLCHVNRHQIDVELSLLDSYERRLLIEVSPTETRQILGRIVRHPEVIRRGCLMLLKWLLKVRAANGFASRDCAAIVFCGNDNTDQTNEHARQIRDCLLELDPSFKAVIATSTDDEPGNKSSGKRILERFVFDGVGDIVIVKQMAGLGLDTGRLKIGLDLSPMRTVEGYLQRVARLMRPYNGIFVGHWITVNDALSAACHTRFIEEEGGGVSNEIEFVSEEEKPKKEKPDKIYSFNDVREAGVDDTKGKQASAEKILRAVPFIEAFPVVLNTYTVAEIVERLDPFSFTPEAGSSEQGEPEFVNTGDVNHQALKPAILRAVKGVVKIRMARQGRRYSADKQDQELYRETIKNAWKEVYCSVGLPAEFDYLRCEQMSVLESILAAAENLLQKEAGE